jgi:hypothetical protein
MSGENAKLLALAVDSFNRGDLEAMKTAFAPDAEIVPLRADLENTIFRGPTAVEERRRNEGILGIAEGGDRADP